MTNISYVATGGVATSGGYQLNVSIPSGVQAGDILILQAFTQEKTSWDTEPPTGWSNVPGCRRAFSSYVAAMFWKRADGTEGGTTVTLEHVGYVDIQQGAVTVWRGCKAVGDPTDAGLFAYSSSDPVILTSIDVPEAGCVELVGDCCFDNYVVTTPSGYTQRYSSTTTTGSDSGLKMFTKDDPAVGATGTLSLDQPYADTHVVFRLVLLPAEEGDGGNVIMWGTNF